MSDAFVFGLYAEEPSDDSKKNVDISLDFVFPLELVSHWRKCSLASNFLANYDMFKFEHQKKAQVVLSTIINELIENAVKYNADQNKLVSVSLQKKTTEITIETMNSTTKESTEKLKKFIETLHTKSFEDLFMEAFEKITLSDANESGLGLLTILKDYHGKLGIKVEPSTRKGLYSILVKTSIPIEEFDNL